MAKKSEQEINIEIVSNEKSNTKYLVLFDGIIEGSIEVNKTHLIAYNLQDDEVFKEKINAPDFNFEQAPAKASRALLQDYFKRHDG